MRFRFPSPLVVPISLLAWALLYAREFLPVGGFERVPPVVPAVLALLAFAALLRAALSVRVKVPLALSALLVGAAGLALTGVGAEDPAARAEWRQAEERDIAEALETVRDRIENLLDLSSSIGDTVGVFVRDNVRAAERDSMGVRLDAFDILERISSEVTRSAILPSGAEVGIQVFDPSGGRWAWAGWPQALDARDRRFVFSGKQLVYSRQVSLYRMLTHIIPVHGDAGSGDAAAGAWLGSVVVDIPLEVNYRVNNKFLKSEGLSDDIERASASNIRFEYLPVDVRLPETAVIADGSVSIDAPRGIEGSEASGLSGRGPLRIDSGEPLLNVVVEGRPFRHYMLSRNNGLFFAAHLALLLVLVIYVGLSLRRFPARWSGPAGVVQAGYLVAAFMVIRYSLIWFQPELVSTRFKVFEPAVFATPILGGLMRSAGDLLITSVFFVAALYGVLQIGRSSGAPSRERERSARGGAIFVVEGLIAAAASIGAFLLAREFIGTLVPNANPRLVGETVKILEPEVIVLHLSAFFMTAGIFLSGMICVWGAYRLGSRADAPKASAVGAAAVIGAAVAFGSADLAAIGLLALLFAFLAPKFVRREDLVSIVIGAFAFVIIVSAAAYVFFNQEYQALRRTFIQEKVAEVTHPADNWKVFILEDILENFSGDLSIRQALADPLPPDVQRLAFDLWAGSPLSLLGYSCAIHVFDASDSLVSRFAVEMPYRLRVDEAGERLETPYGQQWAVLDLTTETPEGGVRFYRGIVNLDDYVITASGAAARISAGKVVVDVPFFFESLAWAARTGPQTPEVLRNVQEGGIAPRLEEPEPIVLARVRGRRVLESSAEQVPVGYTFDRRVFQRAADLQWPLLEAGGATYRIFSQPAEAPGTSLVAGFAVPSPAEHVLRWSMILSVYFFFTVALIGIIILLKNVPVVGWAFPTLTPGRQLGFQQKLLASFLVVALLPAIILGIFSVRIIKQRFVQESRNEALYRAFGAGKALNNLLVDEMHALARHTDLSALIEGGGASSATVDPKRRLAVFTIPAVPGLDAPGDVGRPAGNAPAAGGAGAAWNKTGAGASPAAFGETAGDGAFDALFAAIDRVQPEQVFLHYMEGKPYFGVVSEPMPFVSDGRRENLILYHGRAVDAEFLGEISDQAGADVNVFEGGRVVATSREGLLSGGFISATMNSEAFVKVSMMGVDHYLATEKAGDYSYQVAYVPLPALESSEHAALGVPLLFRPESYTLEVDKARSVVLSIFALLSAATIGLGLFLARGIFRPLRGLLEGTQRIARGDFSVELPETRRDEIGTVVEAFNEMTRQVSRSQTALEERRKYLEVILANIGTGVISTDETGRISAVNSAAERILGMDRAALIGRSAGEMTAGGPLQEFFSRLVGKSVTPATSAAGLASADAPPDGGSSEVDIVKDGQKRTIKYVRTDLATDGRRLGAVIVFEDLTELINSKKLAAWVEMARQIAHEIKNPLTPIKLSTQFMVRAHHEGSKDFDKIFRESSETIMQQVDVLRNIASEFSSFGRLQQLYLAPHNVVALLEEIVAPYKKNTAGVAVIFNAPKDELRAVIDPEAVRKICTNLIENAMEAMAGGGDLQIACAETVVDGRRLVTISFRDTGPGLSREAKNRLFEPYFSTKTTGTGLGLAICRTLSREMGGEVTVENLPGGPGVEAVLYLKAA